MNIDDRTVNGVTILDLSGRLTLGEPGIELRAKIRGLVQSGRAPLRVPVVPAAWRAAAIPTTGISGLLPEVFPSSDSYPLLATPSRYFLSALCDGWLG